MLSLLCVVGITTAVCATGVAFLTRVLLQQDAAVVADLVETLVTRSLPRSVFEDASPIPAARYAAALESVLSAANVVRVILYDGTGRVLWSDDSALIGLRIEDAPELRDALRGEVRVDIIRPGKEEHDEALRGFARLEEMYIPIRYEEHGPVVGVLEIYRDAPVLFAVVSRALAAVWLIGGGGAVVLWVMLLGVVSRAARTQAVLERELTAQNRTLEARVIARTREVSRLYDDTKAMKEYLEHLIESSPDVILTVAANGGITFASRSVERSFGYDVEALLSTSAATLWARGRADYRAFRRALARNGRVLAYETEVRAAGGEIVPVTVSASLLRDADGGPGGAVAVVSDVTELKKLHEQMVRAERLATAGLLAAGVAHEIGNPVACIDALVDMLRATSGDDTLRAGLDDIRMHAGRIEKIVEDFTRLARPAPLEFRAHAVDALVGTAIQLARHNPCGRTLRIATAIAPGLPPVRVTSARILQVFLNLVLNAADVSDRLTIAATRVGDDVRVAFRDAGPGVDAERLACLFDPFYTTKQTSGHMGLGLFVSHEIVRQHGGTILAESRVGMGSTFTVVLPADGHHASVRRAG